MCSRGVGKRAEGGVKVEQLKMMGDEKGEVKEQVRRGANTIGWPGTE